MGCIQTNRKIEKNFLLDNSIPIKSHSHLPISPVKNNKQLPYQITEISKNQNHKLKALTEFSNSIRIKQLIENNTTKAENNYKIISKVGKGSFGSVYKVVDIHSGIIRAMKVINRETIKYQDDERVFLKEIEILSKLEHPNIIKIIEYYTDEVNYYIITEYISGGELYDTIIKCNKFNESKAANIMKQIIMALNYLHSFGIVHRDIKPENILVENNSLIEQDFNIKLIDFGTSNYVTDTKNLTLKVGSPYYIAPEVLEKNYNKQCDVWSAGVILYVMLMGFPPFNGRTVNELFKNIAKGVFPKNHPEWEAISDNGKDLIEKMLTFSPEKRITAQQCLDHPWINTQAKNAKSDILPSVLTNIMHLDAREKFQQATIAYIVHSLYTNKEINELKKVFQAMDLNGDGKLTYTELKIAFEKCFGSQLSEININKVIEEMDNNFDGVISYEEFLCVSVNQKDLLEEKNLRLAFDRFDVNKDGKLSKEELGNILDSSDFEYIEMLVQFIDNNKDGYISYEEFRDLMRGMINKNDF